MRLELIDWLVVAGYLGIALIVGLAFARRAGRDREGFFLSGRKAPWWLLGTSMVATTFSTDTPNLVTDLVRTGGVSQNWLWWSFAITGMLTVFVYSKLWRRSATLTDIGFYELRYSGRPAAFLRGFRALYLGFFFNVMIMATVTLAAIKIGAVLLGLGRLETIFLAATVTALYAATSGLWGIIVTDLLLFVVAMIGSVAAAYYSLQHPDVGGLQGLLAHPSVQGKVSLLPDFSDPSAVAAVLIIPLAVQWWSTWYPGAEPGGGGYVAQRMLAARDEKEAMLSTLWFNVAHYGLRPWPWIIVALCSLIVYPDLAAIASAFPHVSPSIVRHDLAYPAMLVFVPHGVLGLIVASLAAAYMSTISTHLNWGASYIVHDVYGRFVAPDVSERHYVTAGRITTALLTVTAGAVALWLENAMQAFQILLQIGAGTGLIFILRWFWWRISAWSEIAAMVISFVVAIYFQFVHTALGFERFAPTTTLALGVLITTTGWLLVTLVTPPTDMDVLRRFHDRIRPWGAGWRAVVGDQASDAQEAAMPAAVLGWFLGVLGIYAALFTVGYAIYGNYAVALVCFALLIAAGYGVIRVFPRIGFWTADTARTTIAAGDGAPE
ncbi:Na+:solute symporter [soil metagenome]